MYRGNFEFCLYSIMYYSVHFTYFTLKLASSILYYFCKVECSQNAFSSLFKFNLNSVIKTYMYFNFDNINLYFRAFIINTLNSCKYISCFLYFL